MSKIRAACENSVPLDPQSALSAEQYSPIYIEIC